MDILFSIARDFFRFFSIYKKTGRLRLGLLLIVLIAAGWWIQSTNDVLDDIETEPVFPSVSLIDPYNFSGGRTLEFVGTVRSSNEADIHAEVGGRVTAVPVTLGQTVSAGSVIARLENASQFAALLQAEGAYEAAQASAAVGDVSVREAETAVRSAVEQGMSAADSALAALSGLATEELDVLVADESNVYRTNGAVTSAERVVLNSIDATYSGINQQLGQLQQLVAQPITVNSSSVAIEAAQVIVTDVQRITSDITTVLTEFNNEDEDGDEIFDAEESNFLRTLTAVEAEMATTRSALRQATSRINSATEALEKAELSASGGTVSVSDAQVKQALGSLRAAQANYEKTILRTPINGLIKELSVNVGDFVSSQQSIARVINDGGFEVTLFASETERSALQVGNTVSIGGVATGTISVISPGVSATVGKIEFKVVTEDGSLIAGETVRVQVPTDTNQTEVAGPLTLPITAIKFQVKQGSVFTVEDGVLVAHPVTIGAVSAGNVEVINGITPGMQVVEDARGLSAGQSVTTQ